MIDDKKLRVMVVDDSPEFLSAIASFLSDTRGTVITGSAKDVDEAIRMLPQAAPHLLLLDLFLEQGTGMDVLKHLQRQSEPTITIVMTTAPFEELRRECLALGAAGFFDKADMADWLPNVLERVGKSIPKLAAHR